MENTRKVLGLVSFVAMAGFLVWYHMNPLPLTYDPNLVQFWAMMMYGWLGFSASVKISMARGMRGQNDMSLLLYVGALILSLLTIADYDFGSLAWWQLTTLGLVFLGWPLIDLFDRLSFFQKETK